MFSPNFTLKYDAVPNEFVWAFIDTGDWNSVTCFLPLIHNLWRYDASFPALVCLIAAIDGTNGTPTTIIPKGEGYIWIPFIFPQNCMLMSKYITPLTSLAL